VSRRSDTQEKLKGKEKPKSALEFAGHLGCTARNLAKTSSELGVEMLVCVLNDINWKKKGDFPEFFVSRW
jgi:hypothetical protein